MTSARVFILTVLAMLAFASNSLLCRLALRQTGIDAATFTFIRIFSGAIMLWIVIKMQRPVLAVYSARHHDRRADDRRTFGGNWPSAAALFAYAAAFSFAYRTLSAGTGALLLFGAVQATMIFWGWWKGERLHAVQLFGLTVALTGLVALVFPGLSAPPLGGSILMLGAGIAWGVYSLRGKGVIDPAKATAGNFIRAVVFALLISLAALPSARFDREGIIYAIISGALTSGLGYVIWYAALPGLKAASAATVQLSVPVLTATGGILLLNEPLTLRYLLASIAVLGGIALVVLNPERPSRPVTGKPA